MHLRMFCGWIAALSIACGSPSSTPPPPQEKTNEPQVEPTKTDKVDEPPKIDAPPKSPFDPVVQKICAAAPCVGQFSRLVLLRDATGEVVKIRYEGDLHSCSHPPWIYYDKNGVEVVTIPEEPVMPGSPRQLELAEMQAKAVEGLTESDVLQCPGSDATAPH